MKNQKIKQCVFVLGSVFFLLNSHHVHAGTLEQKKHDQFFSVRFSYSNFSNVSNRDQIELGTRAQNFEIFYATKKPVKNFSDNLSLLFSFTQITNEIHGINFGKNNFSADGNFMDVYDFSVGLRYSWNLSENLDLNVFGNVGFSLVEKREKNPVRKIDLETKFFPTLSLGVSLEYNVNRELSFEIGYKNFRFLGDLKATYHDSVNRKLENDYVIFVPFLGFSYKF